MKISSGETPLINVLFWLLVFLAIGLLTFTYGSVAYQVVTAFLDLEDVRTTWTYAVEAMTSREAGIGHYVAWGLYTTLSAVLLTIALGGAAGLVVAGFKEQGWATAVISFVADHMTRLPCIIVGLFAYYSLTVTFDAGYQFWGIPLVFCLMITPTVIATTRDSLERIFKTMRADERALGMIPWQALRHGILSGLVVGVVRMWVEFLVALLVMGVILQFPGIAIAEDTSIYDLTYTMTKDALNFNTPLGKAVVVLIIFSVINAVSHSVLQSIHRREAARPAYLGGWFTHFKPAHAPRPVTQPEQR
ncbi:MAG: ABC transporter permease subunit [Planctomycetes bacterium]|nr:ABC transporter permease subunit [Planctomycetota bacterium]